MYHLLEEPICDGGTFSMFTFLIKKYGITTSESYPQTFQSKNSSQLNRVIAQYLRQVSTQVTTENIESHISKIHKIITMCLALPPTHVQLYEKTNGITFSGSPNKLFGILNKFIDIDTYLCFNHAPNKKVDMCVVFPTNNYQQMDQHKFYVKSIEDIKNACMMTLSLHIPVWFTATVRGGADFSRKLMICDAVEYEKLFEIENSMSKEEMMNCRCIQPSHAMLLIGFNLDSHGKPERWKVQNSWGKETAILSMSDEWFTRNVFEVAVPQECCGKKNDTVPISIEFLKPWDICQRLQKIV